MDQVLVTKVLVGLVLVVAAVAVFFGWSIVVFKKRVRDLEVALVKYPNYADVRAQLGTLYQEYGKTQLAEHYYREALRIYPFYNYARLKLAALLMDAGREEDALAEFVEVACHADEHDQFFRLVNDILAERNLLTRFQDLLKEKRDKNAR